MTYLKGESENLIEVIVSDRKIQIRGHAGYEDAGKDIVCAAISCLVQTFIASVIDLTEDKIKYYIFKGEAEIKYKSLSLKGMLLLDCFLIGINAVSDRYPENVRIIKISENNLGGIR